MREYKLKVTILAPKDKDFTDGVELFNADALDGCALYNLTLIEVKDEPRQNKRT